MKKKIKYLLFIIALAICLIPSSVFAASTKFNVGTSSHSVTVGQTFTVTVTASSDENIMSYEYKLNYNGSIIQLVSGSDFNHSEPSGGTSESKSFTFKAIASGNTTVSLTDYIMGTQSKNFNTGEITLSPTTNITCNAATSNPSSGSGSNSGSGSSSGTTNYSTNNNLATLEIDGQTIEPAFNKDVTDYTISLDESVEKIKIAGTPEDSKSTVAGLGEQILDLGENKYQIIVTSEKGTTKTYNLTINVEDKNPVTTIINGNNYTIIKKASLLGKENNYTESTIKINDIEVPCLKNENNNYILIGLKDIDGNINLYLYNEKDKTYKSYIKVIFNTLSLTIIDNEFNKNGYSKYEEIINDVEVSTYKTSENSNYGIFYALNNTTEEEGYYMYDKENGSVIKYNEEETNILNDKLNKSKIIIISFAGTTLLLIIVLIIVAKKKNKKPAKDINTDNKKETKNKTKEPEEIYNKTVNETTTKIITTQEVDLDKIKLENNLKLKDKKAIKNKEKEESIKKLSNSEKETENTIFNDLENNKKKKGKKKSEKQLLDEW